MSCGFKLNEKKFIKLNDGVSSWCVYICVGSGWVNEYSTHTLPLSFRLCEFYVVCLLALFATHDKSLQCVLRDAVQRLSIHYKLVYGVPPHVILWMRTNQISNVFAHIKVRTISRSYKINEKIKWTRVFFLLISFATCDSCSPTAATTAKKFSISLIKMEASTSI